MKRPRTNSLSLQEAGDLLGCSAKTIRRRISDGQLEGKRIGAGRGTIRVAEDEVLALLKPIPSARPTRETKEEWLKRARESAPPLQEWQRREAQRQHLAYLRRKAARESDEEPLR